MDSFFDTKHLYRCYFKMAFPVVLGLVVTLVYNLADTYFVGMLNDPIQKNIISPWERMQAQKET